MRGRLLAFLAVIGFAHFAYARAQYAATVNLYITTVNATPTGGTWQIYAQDSDDNDGLSSWDLDVLGTGGAVVNSPGIIKAPRPVDISGQYADGFGGSMGFNSSVSSGDNSGTARVQITAQQDSVYAATDDPTYDMGILVGVGQEPSSASPQNGTQGPTDGSGSPTGIATPVWNYTPLTTVSGGIGAPSYQIAGTLIEQGIYTTTNSHGFLTAQVDPGAFVLVLGTRDAGINEPWTLLNQQGNSPIATVIPDTIALPEPTSLGLLGVGIAILSTRTRRTSRRLQIISN